MYKALVVASCMKDAMEIRRHLAGPESKYPEFQFIYPSHISIHEASLHNLLDDCREVIKHEDVDVLLSIHPGMDLVHAVLAKEFGHIRGPSFGSAFIVLHRYYQKLITSGGFHTRYSLLSLDDATPNELSTSIDDVGLPSVLCDCLGTGLNGPKLIKKSNMPWEEFQSLTKSFKINHNKLLPFLKEFLDGDKYPFGMEVTCLLEEMWIGDLENVSVHFVEGCVSNGDVIPWLISDVMFSPNKMLPGCMDAVYVPTRLKDSMTMDIWAIFREIVQKIASFGYDDQFLHAKIMATPSGNYRVVDLNPCLQTELTSLYSHVYQHGDNLKAQLDIGLGRSLRPPKLLPSRFAMKAMLRTYRSGFHPSDVMNVKEAKKVPEVDVKCPSDDPFIASPSDLGYLLANVYVCANNYDEAVDKMTTICEDIVKLPNSTNWTISAHVIDEDSEQ